MPLPLLGAAAIPWLQGLLGAGLAGTAGWQIGKGIKSWFTPPEEEKAIGAPAGLAPKVWDILAGLTTEEKARLPFPVPEEPIFQQISRRQRAEAEAKEVDLVGGLGGFETFDEAFGSLPNENWEVYKNEFGRFDVRRKQAPAPLPTGLTPAQQAQQELEQQQLAQSKAQFEAQMEFQRQPTPISPFQEQQFGLQQQQLAFQQAQAQQAAAEQERQFVSQLAANPMSWLQYASYTGAPPVVQPWMTLLGEQGVGGLQVGQTIPGFEGQQGNQQIQTFADLPQLTTPSAQLQARWGPTAQRQFLGYRQARTGATPEETQFRLGSGRAPTGQFGGFSRFR